LFLLLHPEDPPYLEDMSKEQLQQEIKKVLEEIGKRGEVFVVIIDAINQVITTHMLFASWNVHKVYNYGRGLENAARGCRPGAAFSSRGHSFSLYRPTLSR